MFLFNIRNKQKKLWMKICVQIKYWIIIKKHINIKKMRKIIILCICVGPFFEYMRQAQDKTTNTTKVFICWTNFDSSIIQMSFC